MRFSLRAGHELRPHCNPDRFGRILSRTDLVAILVPYIRRQAISRGERLQVLSDLGIGESGVLEALDLPIGVQNHLMHMGLVPDAHVKALHRAPGGDPTVYSVDGIEVGLRKETARSIRVHAVPPSLTILPNPDMSNPDMSNPDMSSPEKEFVEAVS